MIVINFSNYPMKELPTSIILDEIKYIRPCYEANVNNYNERNIYYGIKYDDKIITLFTFNLLKREIKKEINHEDNIAYIENKYIEELGLQLIEDLYNLILNFYKFKDNQDEDDFIKIEGSKKFNYHIIKIDINRFIKFRVSKLTMKI